MSANTVTFAQNRSIPETAVRFDAWFEAVETRDFRRGPSKLIHNDGRPGAAHANGSVANVPFHGERYVENWVI